jgi:hypothetical protein
MVLISHRGNINGKNIEMENHPSYIDSALEQGFDVEIDIRYIDGDLYLGHDTPDYPITLTWLEERGDRLWIHCKNHQAVEHLHQTDLNWFWHDVDDMTLTSHGFIWAHPKIQPPKNSISVMPDNFNWNLSECLGVCSDYIEKYKK